MALAARAGPLPDAIGSIGNKRFPQCGERLTF
jgi:hypothetical protein